MKTDVVRKSYFAKNAYGFRGCALPHLAFSRFFLSFPSQFFVWLTLFSLAGVRVCIAIACARFNEPVNFAKIQCR